ncbi:hypothetical protein ACP70R_009853 [Stipagrostis hirtigluma subsp. patula]
MEAGYNQTTGPSPSPLWPCTTRRRKRLDSELPPPPQLMDPDSEAQRATEDKLKAVAEELGHEIRVFSSTTFVAMPNKLPSANDEEDDDFYELTPADYFNLVASNMGEQSKMLKTRRMREAELAAQRAKITKAVMRLRFPDGYILEADFLPSERIHSLVDLLMKVLARPDLPFYLYFIMLDPFNYTTDTVPPKRRIQDTSQDFYTLGFVPGANIFFSYDLPDGSELNADGVKSGPYLREEIRSLDGLSLLCKPGSQSDDSRMDSSSHQSDAFQSDLPPATNKKPNKPKWFKSVIPLGV